MQLHTPAAPPTPPWNKAPRASLSLAVLWLALCAVLAPLLVSGCGGGLDSGSSAGSEEVDTAEEAITAGANLALGKPATQSSTIPGNDASRAVDGNKTAGITHTDWNAQPWWRVDLQSSELIGTVVLYNRTDCCGDRLSNFKLRVSDDAATWQDYPFPGAAGRQVSFAVNRRARYVQVQLNGTNYLSLTEVEVYAPPNLALGKPTTQSSTGNNAPASRAVDGNTDGNLSNGSVTHTNWDVQPWWQVDLQSVVSVGTVELFNRTDCCSSRLNSFKLLASADGSNWQTWSYPGSVNASASFAVNSAARYIKVQLDGTNYLSLAEVKVYAAANAATGGSNPLLATRPTSPTGTVEGDIQVDSFGAANYSIPIKVPPGTHGVEPKLSLVYKSGSGNGLLGMGFNLAGLAMITRCPRTQAQDGIHGSVEGDSGDRFCLDGQRLVAVSGAYGANGTEYRTEIDSYSRVFSYGICANGPCSFDVTDRTGNTAKLGDTADSRPPLADGTARMWAVSRVTSPDGDYYSVSYTQDSAQLYPAQILYTLNDGAPLPKQRKVTFEYEARGDKEYGFIGQANFLNMIARPASRVQTNLRMNRIKTFAGTAQGDALAREYRLAYVTSGATQRSLVDTVTECDALGVCLPATQFNWNSAGAGGDYDIVNPPDAIYQDWLRYDPGTQIITGDFNGDGKTDFLGQEHATTDNDCISTFKVAFSNGDGTFNFSEPPYQCILRAFLTSIHTGDFNGDGKTDFIGQNELPSTYDAPNAFNVYLSNGDGTFQTVTPPGSEYQHNLKYNGGAFLIFGDYNGDGMTDFIRQEHGVWADDSVLTFQVYLSKGDGTFTIVTPPGDIYQDALRYDAGASIIPGDFNGDGMTDFIRQERGGWDGDGQNTFQVYLSLGDGTFAVNEPSENDIQAMMRSTGGASIIPGDFNGDGKTDFIRQEHDGWDDDDVSTFRVYFSEGRGHFTIAEPAGPLFQHNLKGDTTNLIPIDYNGDGKTDIIRQEKGDWDDDFAISFQVYVSRGDGNFDVLTPGSANAGDPYQDLLRSDPGAFIHPGDFNGDGKTDFIRQEHGGNDDDTIGTFQVYFAKGDKGVDLLKKVTNGLGGTADVVYAPLTDATVYTKGSAATGVDVDVQSSMYVVKSLKRGDARGHTYDTTYAYRNARSSRDGRGPEGFGVITETNASTGLSTMNEYNQAFPYTGTLAYQTLNPGQPNSIPGEVKARIYSSTVSGGVYKVLLTGESVTRSQDGVSATTSKVYEYDAYGNRTRTHDLGLASTAIDDVDTCETFVNDTTNWRLAFPLVTKIGPSCSVVSGACNCTGPVLQSTVRSYVNGARMSLGSLTNATLTTTYLYDAHGNVVSRTDPNGALENTTYDADFATYPISQETRPKPPGAVLTVPSLVTSFAYDARFGVVTARTDPNGNTFAQEVDGLGRVVGTSVTSLDGLVTPITTVAYGADATGKFRETRTREQWGQETWRWEREYFDGMGRVHQQIKNGNDASHTILVDRSFDANDNLTQESLPYRTGDTPVSATHTYDRLDRPTQTAETTGSVTARYYTVDASCTGCIARVMTIEAYGTASQRTSLQYLDAREHVLKQVDVEGRVTTFGYDGLGQRTSITEGGGATPTTTITYDMLGRQLQTWSADRGTVTHAYDATTGMLLSTTDGNGLVTSYQYDTFGRVTQKSTPGTETVTFEYDNAAYTNGLGRLTGATVTPSGQATPSSKNAFAYTPDGLVKTNVITIDDKTYALGSAYDPDGRLRSITMPDGAVLNRSYTAEGFLSQLEMGGTVHAQYGNHSATGQPGSITYANGTASTYTYDGARRLSATATTGPGNVKLLDYSYAWDALNQIKTINDNRDTTGTQTFTYSPAGQLTGATGKYGSLSYAYDSVGNLISKEGSSYTYSNHRVTSGSSPNGPFTATYDTAGNRTSQTRDGHAFSYTYGAENRLIKVQVDASSASYAYDFSGERVKKVDADGTVTHYVTPSFEVTFLPDGRRLETKYVSGPAGRMAAVTVERAAGSAQMLGFRGESSKSDLHDPRKLAGLAGLVACRARAYAAHPQAPVFGLAALALALALACTTRRARRVLARGLAVVRAAVLPEDSDFIRRHPGFAAVVPLVMLSFLAACGRVPGEPLGYTADTLVAGENGAGNPVAGTYYFHHNHLGSSSVITDSAGVETARAEYKPFGEIYQPASPGKDIFRAKFTGKEWDRDSELYYFNARYYDPITGRFMTADTQIQGGPERDTAALNPYAYGCNNPVIYNDPSGKFVWLVVLAVMAGVAAGAYAGGAAATGSWNPATWDYTSWRTWTGIGVGGLVGGLTAGIGASSAPGSLIVTSFIDSAMTQGLTFLSPQGSSADQFFFGVALGMAVRLPLGAAGKMLSKRASAMAAKATTTFGRYAPKLGAKLVMKVPKYAVGYGIRQIDTSTVSQQWWDGMTASGGERPSAAQVDTHQVADFMQRISDALLRASGADDVMGRSLRSSRSDGREGRKPRDSGAREGRDN